VAQASSCRFLTRTGWWGERLLADWLIRRRGPVILRGPVSVAAERAEEAGSIVLAGRHNGYGPDFGIVHERRWQLFTATARLEGRDAFLRQGRGRMRGHDVAIRFHLHPGIAVRGVPEGLELASALGEVWTFRAENAEIALEESVYFSGLTGPRRTDQIVLHLRVSDDVEVRWSFERLASAPMRGATPP
jgi:uncharacterized heparinase superfamily protein